MSKSKCLKKLTNTVSQAVSSARILQESQSKQWQKGVQTILKSISLEPTFLTRHAILKLLEVIPTQYTDPEVLSFMKTFGEDVLGKGVVHGKGYTKLSLPTGLVLMVSLVTVQEMLKGGYSVGEVDSITGPLIGRPKSATFRTLDVVGLDTFVHVAGNVYEKVNGKEKEVFEVPAFMKAMVEKGWLGSKSGQGFFLKKGKEILELDPTTLEYGPTKKLKTACDRSKQAGKRVLPIN